MSLAPASIRGFFLKARLAVNGIQCAARSFGTLTAGERGLLSSMGASLAFGAWGWPPRYQLRRAPGTQIVRDISLAIRQGRSPQSRTPRPRNPRYRATAATIA